MTVLLDLRFRGSAKPVVRMGAANFIVVAALVFASITVAVLEEIGVGRGVALVIGIAVAGICLRYYATFVSSIDVAHGRLKCEHPVSEWAVALVDIRRTRIEVRSVWAMGELVCVDSSGGRHIARWVMRTRETADLERVAGRIRDALVEQGVESS